MPGCGAVTEAPARRPFLAVWAWPLRPSREALTLCERLGSRMKPASVSRPPRISTRRKAGDCERRDRSCVTANFDGLSSFMNDASLLHLLPEGKALFDDKPWLAVRF